MNVPQRKDSIMADPTATAAARGVLEDMGMPAEGNEAEETPSNAAEPAQDSESDPTFEPGAGTEPAQPDPEDTVEIPDEIRELLEEPDFDVEAEAEVAASNVQEDDEEQYGEYEDANLASERKARIKAEKRAEWLEQRRVEENRGKWEQEALKYFPHAKPFIGKIDATSRRGFLKQANAYHETIAKHVSEVAPGTLAADREKLKEELKAELEASWGKPLVGPGKAENDNASAQDAWETARGNRDLLGMTKARMPHKLLGL
jgi:hypothetical protein